MAQDAWRRKPVIVDEFAQVLSHDRIVHNTAMRRPPVIAQIDRVDSVTRGEAAAHAPPIIRRAEKSVDEDQRDAFAVSLKVQLHDLNGVASHERNSYKNAMKKKDHRRRRFKLHWGGGWITEEARSVTQYHEPSIQLLSFDSGEKSLRFCYYHDGVYQGGPLILNESHLLTLRREIRRNKTIHALLRKLV